MLPKAGDKIFSEGIMKQENGSGQMWLLVQVIATVFAVPFQGAFGCFNFCWNCITVVFRAFAGSVLRWRERVKTDRAVHRLDAEIRMLESTPGQHPGSSLLQEFLSEDPRSRVTVAKALEAKENGFVSFGARVLAWSSNLLVVFWLRQKLSRRRIEAGAQARK